MSSPSPRRALTKLRRLRDGSDNSTHSQDEDSASDEQGSNLSLQPTITGGNSLRDRLRRKSVDDRPDSRDSGSRLSTLIRNKFKKNDGNDSNTNLSTDGGNDSLQITGNHSASSLGVDDSGHSSLLTDDDSEQEGKPKRPPLSTHNSHAGYLTLSAPDIHSQPQPTDPACVLSSSPDISVPSKSTPHIPHIVEPYDIEPLHPRDPAGHSQSTGDLFKGTFGSTAQKNSGDAGSLASAGGIPSIPSAGNSLDAQENTDPDKLLPGVQSEIAKAQGRPGVNTGVRPETPPNQVDTPTTYITPPTPTDPSADVPTFPRRAFQGASPASSRNGSPPQDSPRGRRINLPSKLSQSVAAPLTPTAEESRTPSGTVSQPTNATGFFSSVFTAAQKAADSLSSSIAQNSKPRSVPEYVPTGGEGENDIPRGEGESVKRASTIETLGSGDLNFGHLGLAESGGPSPMSSHTNLPLQNGTPHSEDEASRLAEEEQAAARAVSNAYQEPAASSMSQAVGGRRPLSIASNERLVLAPNGGDQTPPRPAVDGDSIKRSNSVRSKLSGRRRRRDTAGTSGTAGTANTTIMAGLSASATGLGNISSTSAGKRLTGFAVASNKRNKDFHQLFRSVPDDDYLVEDYSAALQRDILLHGRLYVSEGHICFSSNILGWVTNLVISFDEVVSVEKKSTAVIFPNAIVIQTLNARNTFASFVARDSTYELLIGIWKINHPNLKSSLNGVTLDNAGSGDKTEVAEADGSDSDSDSGSEDEIYDEDAEDEAGSVLGGGIARSVTGSDSGEKTISRQPSNAPLPSTPQPNGAAVKGPENSDAVASGAAVSQDFPGPPTHEPTQCSDSAEHYDRPLIDTTIPAPLGKIYSMVFGPASTTFMRKWHIEDQKSRDLNFPDTPLDNEHKTVTFDYIKPLSGAVGPKQTKCITTYNLVTFDLTSAVTVDCSTQNPDVPSGSVFSTKTRYCLMWGPENSTRLVANCTIEWTGKSWLKGPIEKGTFDGQTEFIKSLVAALKAAVTTKPPVKGAAVAKKGKRKGKKEADDAEEASAQKDGAAAAAQQDSHWGIFEPVHGLCKPLISVFGPFITSQTVMAVLLALLLYTWINPPARRGASISFPGYTSPQRLAAYEELWRREESHLWDWLEDRAGLDGVYAPSTEGGKRDRQKILAARDMGKRIDDERMSERQMDDAIRVTEERLSALKDAVASKKQKQKKKSK